MILHHLVTRIAHQTSSVGDLNCDIVNHPQHPLLPTTFNLLGPGELKATHHHVTVCCSTLYYVAKSPHFVVRNPPSFIGYLCNEHSPAKQEVLGLHTSLDVI